MGRVALVALILVAGCGRQLNPEWCAAHSDPACNALTDAAVGSCQVDLDCPDTACLPDGTCAVASSALYVSPSGSGTACTSAAKCLLATAISQATPRRNLILLDAAIYLGAITIDRAVHIVGRNATLEAGPAGPAVTVTNDAAAELDFVTITGAVGASGIACLSGSLHGHAIRVTSNEQGITSACALTLERSIVSLNSDGALAIVAGTIDIHDNFIVNNGNNMLARAANVTIAAGVTGPFAFNTVAYNTTKQNGDPGIACNAVGLVGDGNLVTDNTHRGTFGVDGQVVGVCDFSRSYTAPGTGGNDLRWVNVFASDFHLTTSSPSVLDVPTIACDGRTDFDGDPRPSGGACDYGADELVR